MPVIFNVLGYFVAFVYWLKTDRQIMVQGTKLEQL